LSVAVTIRSLAGCRPGFWFRIGTDGDA
jgi:hypothetical protein